ncbi:ABC transporter permease [Intestinimonas massiliensis]|uniref:ABC transporter permease n=1 Tax=Intestinimonas massiliensis (ex Afouda et al. 2020) TaxID=1673721 RepID=A0AAW5JLT2_9FIRM|nr:ABC transporter permease [Intestinimonas massiliensis (ex Afouda et al. 2020)]MCQ4769330.1 ABC transporter permease [Intestinimonas massiliensis (ex Afouda et al. 2020)]
MADHKNKPRFGSLQPDVEDILHWNDLTDSDFSKASAAEKEDFIQQRKSVSYWADAWRRLRKNTVAMVALCVLVAIMLFAFVGPIVVPYGYDQFNKGAENLHPWHTSLEDQAKLAEALNAKDPEQAVEEARAKAEAEGKPFTAVDAAVVRASAKASSTYTDEEGNVLSGDELESYLRHELGIKARLFGYSNKELERKAAGESVFPHVFGTDKFGRDIMVRVMVGTRVSMLVGVCAALLVLIIGATYGSISGYFGGKVDAVMQRIVEVIYSVPEVLVILLLSAMLGEAIKAYSGPGSAFVATMGANLISMFMAFGMLYWVGMSRIIRGQVLQVKQQEYVTAARALGASSGRIIKRHLLPNCIGQLVVTTCLQIPSAIFLESFLSFLGVGVSAPMTSLGSMASEALQGMYSYPYRLFFPAIILSVMILSFNLFGDGLRDALDPRLKK